MSIKEMFKVSFRNAFREKKNIFYILITIICSAIALLSLTFSGNFSNYIESSITKIPGYRTLIISPNYDFEDYGKSKLLTIEHIDDVYSSKYGGFIVDTDFKNEFLNGKLTLLYGSLKSLPKVTMGRTFNIDDRNVAICPIDFYPDNLESGGKINNKYVMDSKVSLGKSFVVKYYTYKYGDTSVEPKAEKEYTKNFKIVGLYDNKTIMNHNNVCYLPTSDLIEIVDAEYILPPEIQKNIVSSFYAVVDDLVNVDKVKNELKSLGWKSDLIETASNIDTNLVETIKTANIIILSIMLFVVIVITSFYIKKKVLREANTMGILRTCGYNKKEIKKMYLLEILLTNLGSFAIGITIFSIIYFILLNTIFYSAFYVGIKISMQVSSFMFAFVVVVVIPFIIAYSKIAEKLQLDIISLISSEK